MFKRLILALKIFGLSDKELYVVNSVVECIQNGEYVARTSDIYLRPDQRIYNKPKLRIVK